VRVGFDIDGVLADFNTPFIALMIRLTGRDTFPTRPFDIPTWLYPQVYGYSDAEVARAFAYIAKDPTFWTTLPGYPETAEILDQIGELVRCGHDVYFITNRPGATAKRQTERWLAAQTNGRELPIYTVLISDDKAACAKALKLDFYIDDKWENATAVGRTAGTASFLLTRPWNAKPCHYAIRIDSVLRFISCIR
jgi:uncharacterized HAD superfamily protein